MRSSISCQGCMSTVGIKKGRSPQISSQSTKRFSENFTLGFCANFPLEDWSLLSGCSFCILHWLSSFAGGVPIDLLAFPSWSFIELIKSVISEKQNTAEAYRLLSTFTYRLDQPLVEPVGINILPQLQHVCGATDGGETPRKTACQYFLSFVF